jgi:hypothetical protein
MANDRPEQWGATRHRYFYKGHIHHKDKQVCKEHPGCTVEAFRTMAARDAWHGTEGYRAGRDMTCIVLHAEHGEIERFCCDVAAVDYGLAA